MSNPDRRKDIDAQRIGNELYLYLPGGEALAVLNATSMMIWSLCDGDHSPEDMVTVLSAIYHELPQETLRADIQAALHEFQTKSLLETL